ncbi:hypothetical protein TIFTF001_017248 [Ficus carica]|uniref:Uncharacterized protein n=1 Tax=Ficus carica TaxID=3494 RepID=A0AA88A8W4_FICCA|nr:hypothetical protein TIFTF001_017248 [Ficus carica]
MTLYTLDDDDDDDVVTAGLGIATPLLLYENQILTAPLPPADSSTENESWPEAEDLCSWRSSSHGRRLVIVVISLRFSSDFLRDFRQFFLMTLSQSDLDVPMIIASSRRHDFLKALSSSLRRFFGSLHRGLEIHLLQLSFVSPSRNRFLTTTTAAMEGFHQLRVRLLLMMMSAGVGAGDNMTDLTRAGEAGGGVCHDLDVEDRDAGAITIHVAVLIPVPLLSLGDRRSTRGRER